MKQLNKEQILALLEERKIVNYERYIVMKNNESEVDKQISEEAFAKFCELEFIMSMIKEGNNANI